MSQNRIDQSGTEQPPQPPLQARLAVDDDLHHLGGPGGGTRGASPAPEPTPAPTSANRTSRTPSC